ncbi:uncharacterized protein F4822DRAFT_205257 [Hypoxylon trugodes]|uniref:uncharacterized protein n=1 Tax=Hypoxylon trugodes TaxID=326681 RepID=UPI00219E6630|nr:uncharacterized protein F4822DRAFT_205257 [Hypoxylon trugodes]KAI1389573.1 hypothetical protein F4822DRAFT_205257 [Hypoxylon trugodes]
MKVSVLFIAAAAAPGALADFWLNYFNKPAVNDFEQGTAGGIFVANPQITCDNIFGITVFFNSGDVSKTIGMRTVPGNDVGAPLFRDPLDIVEFNTGDQGPGHHTIYADRGYAMVDPSGTVTGHCRLDRSTTYHFQCPDGHSDSVHVQGSSMFFCTSDLGPGPRE